MSGIVGVFASIGEHLPVLNKDKFGEPHPEGSVNRMHYRGTVMIILAFCILVTTTEWVSGKHSDSTVYLAKKSTRSVRWTLT